MHHARPCWLKAWGLCRLPGAAARSASRSSSHGGIGVQALSRPRRGHGRPHCFIACGRTAPSSACSAIRSRLPPETSAAKGKREKASSWQDPSRHDVIPTGTRFPATPDMTLPPDIRPSAFSRWAPGNRSHRHHVGGLRVGHGRKHDTGLGLGVEAMALRKEHMALNRTNAAVGAGGAPMFDVSAPPAPRVPQPARQLRQPCRAESGLTAGTPRRKRHVPGALNRQFPGLLHQDRADETADRGFVGKRGHDCHRSEEMPDRQRRRCGA